MKKFNTTGLCVPRKHYMVDVSGRVQQLCAMVDEGEYVCINRGRQYGKTTTLALLEHSLENTHAVASLDFQRLSYANFATEGKFVRALSRMLARMPKTTIIPSQTREELDELARANTDDLSLDDLFFAFDGWCASSDLPVVLIIDEVDNATNNQVFLDFLAQLRERYLAHEKNPAFPAFRSVILAGVTDVKHLKMQIRPEDQHKPNSPWNIATDFDADMSFSAADIAGMLAQYEADHAIGMDIFTIAREIHNWTGGYPFLVSRLCQLVDKHELSWDLSGVEEAVKLILVERNALFQSLIGKLETYPDLKKLLRTMLMEGEALPYNADHEGIAQLEMYGFVRRGENGRAVISNRMFETRLYDLFILEDRIAGSRMFKAGDLERSIYVRDGRLDMRAVLEGFRRAYVEVYGPPEQSERFSEEQGRKQFLLFLKPIINGTGNYYIEAQTRDQTRTDVIVDYAGERFVIELKVWRGPRYNEKGEQQIVGYLERFGLNVGYMLSFNFNKHKQPGLARVTLEGRTLWEETV